MIPHNKENAEQVIKRLPVDECHGGWTPPAGDDKPDPPTQPEVRHKYPDCPFKDPSGKYIPCIINQGCYPGCKEGGLRYCHNGIDIIYTDIQVNSRVFAIEDGRVMDFKGSQRPGDPKANAVIIKGSDNFLTVYGHVKPRSGLTRGMPIKKGDDIGYVDLREKTNGPHVHLSRLPSEAGRDTYDPVMDRLLEGKNHDCRFDIYSCTPLAKIRHDGDDSVIWPF